MSYRRIISRDYNIVIHQAIAKLIEHVINETQIRDKVQLINIINARYDILIEDSPPTKRHVYYQRYRVSWSNRQDFIWFMLRWA